MARMGNRIIRIAAFRAPLQEPAPADHRGALLAPAIRHAAPPRRKEALPHRSRGPGTRRNRTARRRTTWRNRAGAWPGGIGRCWLHAQHGGLVKSGDAGQTWTAVQLPTGAPAAGYNSGSLAVDSSGALYLINDSGAL